MISFPPKSINQKYEESIFETNFKSFLMKRKSAFKYI